MSTKKEAGEIDTLVASNGNTSRIDETGLHLYPVSVNDSGEGLPYAPVDWPNAGDKWGWRAGKRATSSGHFRDRYLYLPKRLLVRKDGKKNAFRSRLSVEQYLRSEFPSIDVNKFFASFSWMIPSKQSLSSKAARICPLGMEATFFATLMSIANGGNMLGGLIGAGLTHIFDVTKDKFDNLALLIIVCNLSSLLPLPLLGLLPQDEPYLEENTDIEMTPYQIPVFSECNMMA